MILNVFDVTGKNATTYEKGAVFYKLLNDSMNKCHNITLDFTNVEVVTTQFFNSTISLKIKDFNISELQSRITITGLNENGKYLLNYSLKNAIEFYKI